MEDITGINFQFLKNCTCGTSTEFITLYLGKVWRIKRVALKAGGWGCLNDFFDIKQKKAPKSGRNTSVDTTGINRWLSIAFYINMKSNAMVHPHYFIVRTIFEVYYKGIASDPSVFMG